MTIPSTSSDLPHILHVIPTLASGGAERLIATYLSNPALKQAYRHTVVLTDVRETEENSPQHFFSSQVRESGHEVICLGCPGPKKLFRCIQALRRLIREKKTSLVHTHLNWANIAGQIAGRMSRIPVVTSFHSTGYMEEARLAFDTPKWKFETIRLIDAICGRLCITRGIAVSQSVANHIIAKLHIDPGKIQVIYNPVDLDHVRPLHEHPRSIVREQLGLADSSRIILNVGRFISSKGHSQLLEAFDKVRVTHPEAHLVMIGKQSENSVAASLRERIEELGIGSSVSMLPPRHDIADFLAAADVFAFPTKYEGLGIALIEAMACGVPCICSDIEVLREVVQDNVTGLIVPVGDVEALAHAILRILDERYLAERLGSHAKMYVHEKFHPDRKAEEMAQLYDRILGRTRK